VFNISVLVPCYKESMQVGRCGRRAGRQGWPMQPLGAGPRLLGLPKERRARCTAAAAAGGARQPPRRGCAPARAGAPAALCPDCNPARTAIAAPARRLRTRPALAGYHRHHHRRHRRAHPARLHQEGLAVRRRWVEGRRRGPGEPACVGTARSRGCCKGGSAARAAEHTHPLPAPATSTRRGGSRGPHAATALAPHLHPPAPPPPPALPPPLRPMPQAATPRSATSWPSLARRAAT
jgi:hypothetical protein